MQRYTEAVFEARQYQPITKPRKRLVARFTGPFADQTRPRSTANQSSFYDFGKHMILMCFSIITPHREETPGELNGGLR